MMSNFERDRYQKADLMPMSNQFERFELLSAYLDGEVSVEQRSSVQQWLDSDPQFQATYLQLLRLRQEMVNLPIPDASIASQQFCGQVLQKIDCQRRMRRLAIGGSIAVTALLLGMISSFAGRDRFFAPHFADISPIITEIESEPLTIALNYPVVEIPTRPH